MVFIKVIKSHIFCIEQGCKLYNCVVYLNKAQQ